MTPALGSTVIVKQTQPATQLYTLSLHDALPICQLALDLRQRLGTILVRDQLRPKLNRYIRSRDRLLIKVPYLPRRRLRKRSSRNLSQRHHRVLNTTGVTTDDVECNNTCSCVVVARRVFLQCYGTNRAISRSCRIRLVAE